MYDLIIKNGIIIDGSGTKEGFKGDIAISGGTIRTIGLPSNARAKKFIDATDHFVTPGFIDIQNHSDSYGALFKNPRLDSMIRQGITTIVIGQCGSSLAPLLRGSLASLQKWSNIAGTNINWSSMSEFLREISKHNMGVNVATLVGHATLRRDFVGDQTRPLTQKEARQIELLLKRSLREGAWGLSVGLEYSHGRVSDEQELVKLLELVSRTKGIASFHLRDEEKGIEAALNEIIFLVEKTNVKAKISHLKIRSEHNLERAENVLNAIEKSRAKGFSIAFDVYPYTTSAMVLYLLLPEWATEGGRSALLKKITNKDIRQEIVNETKSAKYPYQDIKIASSSMDRTLIGKSIKELAKNQNIDPEEVILRIIEASNDQTIVFYDSTNPKILELFLKHPVGFVATDGAGWSQLKHDAGLTHPRSFGTTANLLGNWTRDKKLFSVERAVWKLSGGPAQFLGLKERGLIREGYAADLVVLDPQKVNDTATFEKPYSYPVGIPFVVLNGIIAIENSQDSGILAGKVLIK